MIEQPIPRAARPVIEQRTRDPAPGSLHKIELLRGVGRGRVLIIVGNGPTINEVPLEKLKNRSLIDIMSINTPDQRVWPTAYWAFCDGSQYRKLRDLWDGYNGIIINSTGIRQQKANSLQIKNIHGRGFSRDLLAGFYIGRSTVYAQMQVALWMEYDHVYLFGIDMHPDGVNGQLHFYGRNQDVDPTERATRFALEAENYEVAAEALSGDERRRFTFCSSVNQWPFVRKFNAMDHRIAVDAILELHT